MITLNSSKETITGSIKGKPYSIPYSKEAYDKLKGYKDKYEAADNPNSANAYSTTFSSAVKKFNQVVQEEKKVVVGTTGLSLAYLADDKNTYLFNGKSYSSFYVPQEIVARIQESESKGIPATPFYKFFARLLRNPVMTQDKANRIAVYISKTWLDKDIYQENIDKGLVNSEARKLATVYQVGVTEEGLLVTYKVSTLIGEDYRSTQVVEEEEEEEVETTPSVDISLFVYQPVRNKKGHFYKRGSDEYTAEYNRQLEEFTTASGSPVEERSVKVNNVEVTKKVAATSKFAEDYIFEPAYQGQSGDAFYCGSELGHTIRVGQRHYLPHWHQVNTNDSSSAKPGLHVGGLDYIQGYNNGDHHIVHNIFVSPEHIGAVVSVEHGDGAMRVKEYFVHSSFIGPNSGLYHSATYAKETDAEWDSLLESAMQTVAEAEAEIARIKAESAKAQAVIDNAF